jgi:glucokinase
VAKVPPECVIGVDLGGTKIIAGAVDQALTIHHRAHRAVPARDLPRLLDAMADAVAEARAAVGGDVAAVGFGVPCLIDEARAIAASSVHTPLGGIAVAEVMAERLGMPAFVANDANLALLAEHRHGAAAGESEALMLTLGTGVGGAVLVGGELYKGASGAAGELGHIALSREGPDCGPGCPSRGCLEAYTSGTALAREARAAAAVAPQTRLARALREDDRPAGPIVTELAHQGDADARALLRAHGEWLGVGLASLVNIFNPSVIVIGGGVIAAGELLLEPARAMMRSRALAFSAQRVAVLAARFGAESGMIGAALLARESVAAQVRV